MTQKIDDPQDRAPSPEEIKAGWPTASLMELFHTIRKRSSRANGPFDSSYTRPGWNDCSACRNMREELENILYLRYQQLTCPNHQHMRYCDEHVRFYHQIDSGCPECRALNKASPAENLVLVINGRAVIICSGCMQTKCEC